MTWSVEYKQTGVVTLQARLDQPVRSARVWTAESAKRDFRPERWVSRDLKVDNADAPVTASIEPPRTGYEAFLIETNLVSPSGAPYKLSTGARVNPDTIPRAGQP